MLTERLTDLKKELVEYGALVESMIEKSMRGLLERDSSTLVRIIEQDELRANQQEIDLDETCTSLIAQFQPAAGDLRAILMISRMNNDLERLADHAVNIAQSSLYLIERPQVKPLIDLPKMSRRAISMLKESINSFINEDEELALKVCEQDNEVDDYRRKILTELINVMTRDPLTIERSLHLLRISSNLERIADLSTNIGEDVIFMVKGRIIKHHQDEAEEA
ncbi:MAG: phosphate signaling complex protein PhoU [Candidatus Omnitrophica bacterium]|nr:phosphate signaling complex protein PhoU [Candidatus Omnitrophota bacterium]